MVSWDLCRPPRSYPRFGSLDLEDPLKSPYSGHNKSLRIQKSCTPKWVPRVKLISKKCSPAGDTSSNADCKDGNTVDIRPPDHFFWTAVISRHNKCGQGRQALKVFREMFEAGVKPNSYTFVAALTACSKLQDLESARQIHGEVVEGGFESDLYVGTALVDAYAKCGNLEDAARFFNKMPCRDVVSWNAMILGYAKIEAGEDGLQLYARMHREGVVPNGRTFVGALRACKSLLASKEGNQSDMLLVQQECLERVQAIHSDIRKMDLESDVFVGTMLVDVYAKCGSLVDARRVFHKVPHRNVVAWTAMILGYAQRDEGEEALQLYSQMLEDGVVPDERTFVAVLKAWSSLAALKEGYRGHEAVVQQRCLEQVKSIHSHLVRSGSDTSVFVGSMLVDVYAKCGCLVEARRVFERMPQRNVVSWTAMILGYAQLDDGEIALELYAEMEQEGVIPSERTFVGALKACSNLAAREQGVESDGIHVKTSCLEQVHVIHSGVVKWGFELNMYLGSMLVDVYAKCGSLVDARQVFEKMPNRNVVSWTAMILGYAQMDEGDVALELYSQMQREGVVPDERTFVGALKACSSLAALEKGMEIHAQICNHGLKPGDIFVSNALIDMYGKCGSMASAQQVFNALGTRDVVTWNALIGGYARQGESELVFDLFQRMREECIQPDGITFLGVLTACSHAGVVDEGQKHFDSMTRDSGIAPTIDHYTCMLDLFGRAGQLDKVMEMVDIMPFAPSGAVWLAVLGACRKWGNLELGRHAFQCAVELAKKDPAAYSVMSNIYAAAHMWEDEKEIEELRLETGTWRKPGQSWWTDLCGTVHRFGVGDRKHSGREQIYTNLKNMSVKMREQSCCSPQACGYVALSS